MTQIESYLQQNSLLKTKAADSSSAAQNREVRDANATTRT